MYVSQRLRYHELFCDIAQRLENMALDPRGFPGVATEVRQLKSSASTPSLRSRESAEIPMGGATPDNGGGNVRVVVRVRGFLPRGVSFKYSSRPID
jgi:hypothetical protein